MKINLKNTVCECFLCFSVSDRFKLFKFKLDTIKKGLCIPHKRKSSTYFFCQRVDVFLTDDEFKIVKIMRNVKSEKFILGNKMVYYTFFFPTNVFNHANIGDKFKVTYDDNEIDLLDKYNARFLEKYKIKKEKLLNKKV